ncbi:BAG family molecular chaperone regulator 3-like [Nicotiana tomentosiformis]|uniref:BAG family molecular chaperone regulator 3-like n=1 Tax=Nicotiana tomentosiformis TaxID=4098 RepID=UPI00051B05FF|nr:BAG family molecular chaperone regulator 3-like [Nicotiana tomentosiformis]
MSKDLLKMKTKPNKPNGNGLSSSGWEMRPGGMLVQQRSSDSYQSSITVPTIKVKVKYGSSYHEVKISSQATFGELKKMLAGQTGLHPEDQKIFYKEKERDSRGFLDVAGLKDGSKLVLIEDEISREKRFVESRRNAKMENASKEITAIRLDIDKLAKQVANVEMDIYGGKKVTETLILSLIELLMTQLIKLDGITADGDLKLQRRMQVKRVQKYIETLDMLKIRNSALGNHNDKVQMHHKNGIFTGQMPKSMYYNQEQRKRVSFADQRNPGPVVVTTKWETF